MLWTAMSHHAACRRCLLARVTFQSFSNKCAGCILDGDISVLDGADFALLRWLPERALLFLPESVAKDTKCSKEHKTLIKIAKDTHQPTLMLLCL